MKINFSFITILISAVLFINEFSFSQPVDTTDVQQIKVDEDRILPFWADWAKERGMVLPEPFGVSAFFTYMGRGVDITNVTVQFLERPAESINEFASFGAKNQTYVMAVKLDAWILPLLNIYFLGGYATTEANLDAIITIDRQILPSPPVEIEIQTSASVKGPYTGFGATLVAGYESWFIMGDANYGKTWPDKLNNAVNFTLLSIRSGFSGKIGEANTIRGWLGAAYMDSECTLEISVPSNTLGEVVVKIEQHPINPWTYQCGFSLGVGKSFEFMTELGSNFDDASIFVLNAAYRF